jgi:tetratricopeptide (TPR) repeat protein
MLPGEMAAELRERIARAAGGNPLFVEEMVAVAADGNGEVAVPPTLRALLGARLDQLDAGERIVLERAAVEGEVFHRGAVQALMADETRVAPRLAALVRQQLVMPDRAQLAGEDGFRFRHLLIRDAAYESLPKAARADLHVRFAAWLEQRGTDLVELDEILGYHLEQGLRYRAELGLPRDEGLAASARDRLGAAGHRAYDRLDYHAAMRLLERAAATLPAGAVDLRNETTIIDALFWGGDMESGLARAKSLVRQGRATDDRVVTYCGLIKTRHLLLYVHPEGVADRLERTIQRALPVFHAADAGVALYVAYGALAWLKHHRARIQEALAAIEQAVTYVPMASSDLFGWRGGARVDGPTPAADALAWFDEAEQREARSPWLGMLRARTLGMLGRIDEARNTINEVLQMMADRGESFELALWTGAAAEIEFLAGDTAAAAELVAEECEQLQRLGEQGFLSTASAYLAQLLCTLDRLEEANKCITRARTLGASDDVETQYRWRLAKAVILARTGDGEEAERLAREAVSLAETTDNLNYCAGTYADLAQVLILVGKPDEAAVALREALTRYEQKGNLVMSQRTRDQLAITPLE